MSLQAPERHSPVPRVPRHAAPVRVASFIDNMGIGGTELNALRTAERLRRDAVELTVVTMRPAGPLAEAYAALGIEVVPVQVQGLLSASGGRAVLQLARWLRQRRIDVVHSHDLYSNVLAAAATRLAWTPALITSRRWWQSLPHLDGRYGLANRLAYRLSTRVLANSPAVATALRAEGVPSSRIVVVSNFVEDAAFAPLPEAERASRLEALGVPSTGALVLGCVARLDGVKDHATLLRAFARLRADVPRAHLLLIGDGPEREALTALANELGVRETVHFAGTRREAAVNNHALFDVSVLASRSEGFPNTLVEAMAAARPVVATAVGGSVDAVVPERTGLLVPPGDADALSAAMRTLATSDERRAAMGRAGRERAWETYRADGIVRQVEALYAGLAARRRSPAGAER